MVLGEVEPAQRCVAGNGSTQLRSSLAHLVVVLRCEGLSVYYFGCFCFYCFWLGLVVWYDSSHVTQRAGMP